METPLNASATSAGALISSSTFVVPQYQREYAWERDEVQEFWDDLRSGLDEGTYFLGLVILTDEESSKHVVDGQQRILTLTLLASCLYHEAVRAGRKALADRIQADFLSSIDYETDDVRPRVRLSDDRDNRALQAVIAGDISSTPATDSNDFAGRLVEAARRLGQSLRRDLESDPFKRLGLWTDFLTNRVYLAVFVHPDPASAYRVFEVINTRGRELTTGDLLKNYILSQTPPKKRPQQYKDWQAISRPLASTGQGTLVQYIRHVVTLKAGHVLPRDLFAFLSSRNKAPSDRRVPPTAPELVADLQSWLPLYLQITDPTLDGPAETEWLSVFAALQDLGIIAVRPLLLAISLTDSAQAGMEQVLRLVVRRIVVGNLGTGNVERRLSEAARDVYLLGSWNGPLMDLNDLNPTKEEFVEQLRKRSYNKGTLGFLRRSVVQASINPERTATLHLVRPRQASDWAGFPDDDYAYWGSTIGNTILATAERRPKGASTFNGFVENLLPLAAPGEGKELYNSLANFETESVEHLGKELAESAANVWFPDGD